MGKAVFVEEPDVAMLKVSFFGPFYSGYNVAALDPDYKYALVIGRNLDYMWLLRAKDYARKSEGQIPRNRQGYRLRHLQTGVGGTVTGPRSPVIRRKDGSTLPSFLRIPVAAME